MDEGGSRNPFLRLFSKKKTDDEQMEQEIISMVDEAHGERLAMPVPRCNADS